MKKLLVLANEFPYGTWEPYMETEESFYSAFDKVWIASLQLREEHAKTRRELKSNAAIIPVPYMSKIFYLVNSLSVLGDKELYRELWNLRKSRRLSWSRMIDLFVFLSRAHHEARVIDRALKNEDKSDLLLYSYRFEYQPYIAILLNKKWKKQLCIVSRAHRYDIYEEQHTNNYIPLRGKILNSIDYVFPCSKHGVKYIKEKYGAVKALVECKYLGTIDYGERHAPSAMKPLRIVSCSNVVKVKRLEKIVNALSMMDDIEIEWTHYGDGPLLAEVKRMAREKIGRNVKTLFPGNIANSELLKAYGSIDYHVFLNVSSSEGLPVSIMEAMSFGIPCIATDVGGTRELVNNENGFLLEADADDVKIADVIRRVAQMSVDEYLEIREKSRTSWNHYFNAKINYSKFVNLLKNL